jgi:hypothetical protein
MPLTRTLKARVLALMAGKPVIRQGNRFVFLTGKNLETYNEIERLAASGETKEAERILLDLGRSVFGEDFDPNATE